MINLFLLLYLCSVMHAMPLQTLDVAVGSRSRNAAERGRPGGPYTALGRAGNGSVPD